MKTKNINKILEKFLISLDAINDTLPMIMILLNPYQKKAISEYQKFISEKTEVHNIDGKKTLGVKVEQVRIYEDLAKNLEISTQALDIVPNSLFVALVSQYDALLNLILKWLFEIHPEYINSSEKNISFSELIELKNIETAKEFIIEKEIETVLRKSHTDHFVYLENKLNIPLRKNLNIWPTFIEITERRNLFVHCNGLVSNQYLAVCKNNSYDVNDIKLNQTLEVDPEYLSVAYNCLYEISVKLTHTLWRKLRPEEFKEADDQLNKICFNLLRKEKFDLADILLDFANNQKKFFNEVTKNIFVINRSLSQYLQNNKEKAKEIINFYDWSACNDTFKLAHLILNENFRKAYELMKKIGASGEVSKQEYKEWPLFYTIRNEEQFKNTYLEIFEESYEISESPKSLLQDFIYEQEQNELLLRASPEVSTST